MSALDEPVATSATPPKTQTAKVVVPAVELRKMLDRALNTMYPEHWPEWASDIMGGHVVNGKVEDGILPTDSCMFMFTRVVKT